MHRHCHHLLLILALMLQALLLLSPAQVSDQAEIVEHALLHESGVGHRHHDEYCSPQGDYDVDTAVFHVHHDAVSQIACLPPAVTLAVDVQPAALDIPHVERSMTSPYLEVPVRPPRTVA